MTEEFNLSEERKKLFKKLIWDYPNYKWAIVFDEIARQDKEFIRRQIVRLSNPYPKEIKTISDYRKYLYLYLKADAGEDLI